MCLEVGRSDLEAKTMTTGIINMCTKPVYRVFKSIDIEKYQCTGTFQYQCF